MKNRYAVCAALSLFLFVVSVKAPADEVRPGVLRTPDERFENLPGYPFAPHYEEIDGYRVHYVDEGPRDGAPVLMLHGEPSWSYLYRKMIPIFVEAGYRAIAPDLVGFGRSDKPVKRSAHSYQMHVDTMAELVRRLDLHDATLFCQDWGGLVGLRLVAASPERFARVVAANTGLPAGPAPDGMLIGTQFTGSDPNATLGLAGGFMDWLKWSQTVPVFHSGIVVQAGTLTDLPAEIVAAYDAPFPDESYNAGPRVMPTLVMSQQATNAEAWKVLEHWKKPFLTLFSEGDPITKGGEAAFKNRVPGAAGQPHEIIQEASHFLQEDQGEVIARKVVAFIQATQAED